MQSVHHGAPTDSIIEFSSMTTNPDIIIATPGRFLHLKVEMGLDLSSVRYICFDEADRLFEMGFASQLAEILHALPTSRQTLLFSATLPKSLVEFARAGLQEPKLIRLDAESKISPDLKSAYFTIKSGDRDGALLYLLEQVIKVPTGETDAAKARKEEGSLSVGAKRKRKQFTAKDAAAAESTIIFAATKHRVEYLSELLKSLGYPVSYCKLYLSLMDFQAKLITVCSIWQPRSNGSQSSRGGIPFWTHSNPCCHRCCGSWC